MANTALDNIDSHAANVARLLGVTVSALEALVLQYGQSNPTSQGLNTFWTESQVIVAQGQGQATWELQQAINMLERSLSVTERAFYFSHRHDDETMRLAQSAIGAFLEQSRVAFVKRLRGIVAARAFGMSTKRVDPLIMDRAGRRRVFSEFAYLTARQILMDWINNTRIGYCQYQGYAQFWVDDSEIEVIAVYDVANYPTLSEELFHPRAQRLVGGAYVPSESNL